MNKIHYTRDKIMSDEDKRQIFFSFIIIFLKFLYARQCQVEDECI